MYDFKCIGYFTFEIYHFNWQTKQAADSLRNVIETKLDIFFEAEIYSFQKMHKPKRKFVSFIHIQQEKGEENERGNRNYAKSPFCYVTGLSGCKIFT